MKKTEAERFYEVFERVIREQNLDTRMLEHRALTVWGEVTGPYVNRITVDRRCAAGVLCVRIDSAPARQELMMRRSGLIDAINARLGSDIIKEIKFF